MSKLQAFLVGGGAFVLTVSLFVPTLLSERDQGQTPSTPTSPVVTGVTTECPLSEYDSHVWLSQFVAGGIGDGGVDGETVRSDASARDTVRFAYGAMDTAAGTLDEWIAEIEGHEELWKLQHFRGPWGALVERRSPRLATLGYEAVVTHLTVTTDGCQVVEVAASSPVSVPTACAFLEAFPDAASSEQERDLLENCLGGRVNLARAEHVSLWVGDSVLVMGGYGPGLTNHDDGFLLHPDGSTHVIGVPPLNGVPVGAVRIPNGLLAWSSASVDVAAYDLTTETWTDLTQAPGDLIGAVRGIWTGERLYLAISEPATTDLTILSYDPTTDNWTQVDGFPLIGRIGSSIVWTGSEIIIWGGRNGTDYDDGAAFQPATNSWRILSTAELSPRSDHTAIWTGTHMVIWGGRSLEGALASGAIYDPETDRWGSLPEAPIDGRYFHVAVWTGSDLVVWGGKNSEEYGLGDGAALNTDSATWRRLANSDLRPRCWAGGVWTGTQVVVYGGAPCEGLSSDVYGDGAAYDPVGDSWRSYPQGR